MCRCWNLERLLIGGNEKGGRRRWPPARRGEDVRARARGSAWAPQRELSAKAWMQRLAHGRAVGARETAKRFDASSRCVAGVAHRADHRRRPAQVFYRLRDGWDVGMCKPSAFTVPPRPHSARPEGFEPSYPGLPDAVGGPGTYFANALRATSPSGRPGARTEAGLAWTRLSPARCKELRHARARVKWILELDQIAA